jgi:hypothetical protein
MAEPKTTRNDSDVAEFLATVADEKRRADAEAVCELMAEVTGAEPAMWGSAIVGFGEYRYKYASGREGNWPAVGMSPRKQALTLYVSTGFEGYDDLMSRLGPHRTSKACLYVKRLSDLDQDVLRELVKGAYEHINGKTFDSEPI